MRSVFWADAGRSRDQQTSWPYNLVGVRRSGAKAITPELQQMINAAVASTTAAGPHRSGIMTGVSKPSLIPKAEQPNAAGDAPMADMAQRSCTLLLACTAHAMPVTGGCVI